MESAFSQYNTQKKMTAYTLMGDREKYLKMGIDGYLSKPFSTRKLVGELLKVVSACRQLLHHSR